MQTLPCPTLLQRCLAFTIFCLLTSSVSFAAEDLKPEEIIKRHQDAIGAAQVRSGLASRVVEGTALYKILVGGSGSVHGKGVLVSQGPKLHLLCKINTVEYLGEMWVFDGSNTFIAGTYSDKSRSELGDFVRTQDGLLREGLLGSTLSTAWPMLNGDTWKKKASYQGIKKIDGRELYAFRYKGKADLETTLYFDPETFQHVLTTGRITIEAGMGLEGELSSVRRQQTRYRIEERFADFKSSDGLSFPTRYELRFTEETADGFTKSVEWDLDVTNVANNVPLDPRNFDAK